MKRYKWCIHCNEFHLISDAIWEYRMSKKGVRTPYRCKIARSRKYHSQDKEKMAKYYAEIEENRKIFINERKRLRTHWRCGNISEEQFNIYVADAYNEYKEALNEKNDGIEGPSASISKT